MQSAKSGVALFAGCKRGVSMSCEWGDPTNHYPFFFIKRGGLKFCITLKMGCGKLQTLSKEGGGCNWLRVGLLFSWATRGG